jgi:osmoprotectant transport system permease protein
MAVAPASPAPAEPAEASGPIAAEDLLEELGGPPKLWRWLATPLLLGGAALALYSYIQNQNLPRAMAMQVSRENITERIVQHLSLTGVSTLFVILIAVPLGILLTRPATRRLTSPLLAVANMGQAIPSYGVLVLFAVSIGIGFRYAVYALVLYAVLPVLRNTMVGLEQVDESLIEAGRGMGLTSMQVLRRIELPLAVPVVLAGIRTALVINVGTATLATFTGAGGLGALIDAGRTRGDLGTPVLLTGAALTAIIALTIDWIAGIIEDVLRPKGL